ncbi:NUDIX domain-containing protein [Cohnella sp. GCM10027633]|uniref:NUDIX hydrolase n=1 Tax=unclassified Cohnella TaxID=2636738 RepID=UPI00364484A8
MNYSWHEIEEKDKYVQKYVVIIAKYKNQYILIRNKSRLVWELPGGKIEKGEEVIEAASRELYEETGALVFNLSEIGIYQMNGEYGVVLEAEVEELGELPEFEIAEIRLVQVIPKGLNYGEIYYQILEKYQEVKKYKEIKTETVNLKENVKL